MNHDRMLPSYTDTDFAETPSIASLIKAICFISVGLCIEQVLSKEELYKKCLTTDPFLTKETFEDAISICKNSTIITGITPDGLCYQTLSIFKQEQFSEKQKSWEEIHKILDPECKYYESVGRAKIADTSVDKGGLAKKSIKK